MNYSSQPSVVHAHVWISGKVQGVGYRFATVARAQQAGIRGWVRNLDDRRVEAIFEGPKVRVEKMVDWCHSGSDAAIVQRVEVEYRAVQGFKTFEVRY
ncbi:acylphosphatase [Spirulina major]|uniref:acylphosphatase n=1 Tax=Spirulina major TaxID=270636 RepID=UPI000A073210|nr:acylphosphatase [Spirulina major]